jgi:hypothetical protein
MSYFITKADSKEFKEALLSLWHRNFVRMPNGRYGWIYENNPSGPPLVFLLHHDESNAIVGGISLFTRSAYLKGKPVPEWILGDLVVD